MRSSRSHVAAFLAAAVAVASASGMLSGAASVQAQVFGPPMTIFGSVTDSSGEVPADLVVEAYVGNKVCGRGLTQFTGDGDGRVTVYYADVVSREQTPDCGAPGGEVRVRIGDRFANQTTDWRAGPVQMDVTFGDATPAPIPTFTPTPRPTTPETPEPPAETLTPIPQGTPTAGATPSPSPTATLTATRTATPTATPTLVGSLITRQPSVTPSIQDATGDDGGFPVWAAVVIGVGAIVALGGGIGYVMARSRPDDEEPLE